MVTNIPLFLLDASRLCYLGAGAFGTDGMDSDFVRCFVNEVRTFGKNYLLSRELLEVCELDIDYLIAQTLAGRDKRIEFVMRRAARVMISVTTSSIFTTENRPHEKQAQVDIAALLKTVEAAIADWNQTLRRTA